MKAKLTLLVLLISIIAMAQNGINYKAIIKDNNGNVVANDLIAVQFSILQGVGQVNVYQESHTPTTDANGLIVLNIGEGTTGDIFTDINWANDDHFLNIQINTGSGLVDLGTTQFLPVPYALNAIKANNVNGLEVLDEGNGMGWRLVGRNPIYHGFIGLNAIDLSYSNTETLEVGARGTSSTTMGYNTTATGNYAIATGYETRAESAYETVIGRYNIPSGITEDWILLDPLFTIGNGTSFNNRNNALTVLKSGQTTLNATGTGLTVNASGTGLVTEGGFNGIKIDDPVITGLTISNPGVGLAIYDSRDDGIYVANAESYGAYLNGDTSGVFAVSSNNSHPDIILGGNSSANGSDDGILTSDPQYSSSDLYFRSNDGVIIELDDDDNESGSFVVRNGNNSGVFSVDESGTIRQNGTTIHASDKRLKKDIEPLDYGLKEILQLQPKQYFWKNKKQQRKSLGLIAQDLQSIIHEIVNIQDDELHTLGISYIELIPVLINAIKEQNKIINTQKKDISELTLEVNSIKELLTELMSSSN